MTKKISIIGLALTAFVLVGDPADARLPEPYHVIWGTVSACGVDVPSGVVIDLHPVGDPDPVVSYTLGSDPTLGKLAALRVPLDAVDPQDPGTLRPGDEVEIFIRNHGVDGCPELAGITDVGSRGTFQRLDLDPNNVESLPSVNITDGSVVEGDAGTVLLTFDIFLSEESENPVEVSWVTDDDNPDATATPNDDYTPESDTVTINPGDLSVTIDVEVVGEELEEPDEVFFVQLVSTNGEANILDNLGRGTILDDDTPPTIAINNVTVREPPFASVEAVFRISLSHVWEVPVSVDFATSAGTATANIDYLPVSGTATVPAGQLSTTVAVEVVFDDTDEDDETFFVDLSNPVNGTILDGQGQGTIVDIVQFLIYIEQLVDGVGPVGGLGGAWAVTVSPDGEHVYVASRADDSIVLFDRDLVSGELSCSSGGCVRYQDGVDGVEGLDGVEDLVVTSDGLNLYAVG
ncbi:MAG: Calx-beta domain-containing protein, partial [Halobacteriales archaeon]|nr:Calx-beta domain-containing protein [Halobacteriales archaeon]